jgi:zinc finger HIT domain-containing protein 1
MPHIEVLQAEKSTAAPGWAYVYDRPVDPSRVAIDPTSAGARGKSGRAQRAAAATTVASGELSRREQIAIQRRLAELDKDGGAGKEVNIPTKWKDFQVGTEGGGVGSWGKGRKITTNVRRVLLSEKTFTHHLEDEEAKLALAREAAASLQPRRPDPRRDKARAAAATAAGGGGGKRASITATVGDDVEMTDAPEETPGTPASAAPITDPPDDPLLEVETPTPLTDEELEELLSHPPLSYNAARAAPPDMNAPPQRKFCEMCGYWGRVKCLKCGARVCGLDCKDMHDNDCRKRFA